MTTLTERLAKRREHTEPFEVIRLATTRLACVRFVGDYNQHDWALSKRRAWAEPLGLLDNQNLLGVYWDDQEITAPDKTRSDAALVVPPDLELGEGIQERFMPEGHYACVHHRGPDSLRLTYERYFRDWYPRTGWKPAARPMLVEYDDKKQPYEASLFVAVKR